MLDPYDRRSLREVFRPDPGFMLDQAVGTTFSLDLTALLMAPLAFSMAGEQDSETPQDAITLKLLDSLQRYRERIHLFCQVGCIHSPVSHHALYTFLEQVVIQVQPHQSRRVFHPKLWVLRYVGLEPSQQMVRYRIVCASRNLTFDRSWDTALVLTGDYDWSVPPQPQTEPIRGFLRQLPALAVATPSQSAVAATALMADELAYVKFVLPEGVSELKFYVLGLDEQPRWPFKQNLDRLAVVSPFLEQALLQRLASRTQLVMLVSRMQELQALTPALLQKCGSAYILAEEALPETGSEPALAAAEPVWINPVELSGLHGKLYIGEQADNAFVWTGSANATSAAFGGNVEIIARLSGARKHLGIDAFREACESRLLRIFQPCEQEVIDPVQQTLEELLEEARDAIIAQRLHGQVRPTPQNTFAVDIVPAVEQPVSSRVHVLCRPISLSTECAVPVLNEGPRQAVIRFERLSQQALTTFLVFHLRVAENGQSADLTFVLNVPLCDLPISREASILSDILQDKKRLLLLISLLLQDATAEGFTFGDDLGMGKNERPSRPLEDTEIPLLETMVRALHRNPRRIDAVQEVLELLQKDPKACSLIPDEFLHIWQPILAARKALNSGEHPHGKN